MRDSIRQRLPKGYVERMNRGMITDELPLEEPPDTVHDAAGEGAGAPAVPNRESRSGRRVPAAANGQPLGVVALAAQARPYAVYLPTHYSSDLLERLRAAHAETGIKFDMGKSCLCFRNLAGIDLDAVGDVVASLPPERLIELYEASPAS